MTNWQIKFQHLMLILGVEITENSSNKKKLSTFAFQNLLQNKLILTVIVKIYGKKLGDC